MTCGASVQGEESIVQGFLAPLAASWHGAYGLADDCAAVLPAPGQEIVLKTDPIRAGVHFFTDDAPADIAWKALAVNVSDLAAKSARPLCYTMALSFPDAPLRDWMQAFAEGLAEAQSAFGITLVGGDTDRAPGPLSIGITVLGEVPVGRMVRRATARPGDQLFVSGTLGDAALGLALRQDRAIADHWRLTAEQASDLLRRYLRPQPRLGLKAALRNHARAAMDLSDGLAKDLARMTQASGCGARVEVGALPVSSAFQSVVDIDPARFYDALSHGDDYEILVAVTPDRVGDFIATAAAGGVSVTRIGEITSGRGPEFVSQDGRLMQLERTGYDHF